VDDTPIPGQVNRVVTPECINAVMVVIHDSCHINMKESAMKINLNHGSIQHTVHDELGFHNKMQDLRFSQW